MISINQARAFRNVMKFYVIDRTSETTSVGCSSSKEVYYWTYSRKREHPEHKLYLNMNGQEYIW